MGGDDAPGEVVAGARIASEEFGIGVLLVGRLEAMGDVGDLEVVEASEVIAMGAEPASSVRRMTGSGTKRKWRCPERQRSTGCQRG